MSLVNLAHVCSHLQNASRARLALTSIPHTKLHLSIALQLQKQGFISSVQLGSSKPPVPTHLRPQQPVVPVTEAPSDDSLAILENILQTANADIKDSTQAQVDNILSRIPAARRRLWLGLKFWNNSPVLSKMTMISKPTKRLWLNSEDIGRITRGRAAGQVKGMTGVGECVLVSTDRGILEARECAELKVGGMMLCRVI